MDRKEKYSNAAAGFVDSDLATDMHDKVMIWLDTNIVKVLKGIAKKTNIDEAKIDCKWEYPIVKGSAQYKSIVGYIDMFVFIDILGKENADGSVIYDKSYKLAFEVKSKIGSIGEVIRQIRQYQTFIRPDSFIIVSPDDRFKDLLESQGVLFVHCPAEELQ
jgi:hypothetical protein